MLPAFSLNLSCQHQLRSHLSDATATCLPLTHQPLKILCFLLIRISSDYLPSNQDCCFHNANSLKRSIAKDPGWPLSSWPWKSSPNLKDNETHVRHRYSHHMIGGKTVCSFKENITRGAAQIETEIQSQRQETVPLAQK